MSALLADHIHHTQLLVAAAVPASRHPLKVVAGMNFAATLCTSPTDHINHTMVFMDRAVLAEYLPLRIEHWDFVALAILTPSGHHIHHAGMLVWGAVNSWTGSSYVVGWLFSTASVNALFLGSAL